MNTKKILVLIMAVMMLTSMLLPAQADSTVLFEDDFSSSDLAAKWKNPALDTDPSNDDTECENVATVENGALELNNLDQFGSFFYMGMGDLKLLNFTITMRVKAHQFNDAWMGVSFRKDFNDRFNGCNNNFATLTFRTGSSGETVVTAEAYRGYAGSGPVPLENKATTASVPAGIDEWVDWRLEVKDTSFKTYVNGVLIGQWEYKKNQNEGFISLNCCIFDGAVDDIKLMEYEPMSEGGSDPTDPTNPDPTNPSESNPVETPTEPLPPATNPPKQPLIDRKYKDVSINNTFNVITLERLLNVEELLDSFYLADDVSIRLVDADGAEVTDKSAKVVDTMKLEVMRGGDVLKTYTLVINAEEPTEPTTPAPGKNEEENDPTILIVAIAAAAVVVIVIVVVIVVKNKKGKQA